jgi:hypothetical protein
MGRNGHQKLAARAKHPTYLSESGEIVVEMLDNIERGHKVKRRIGEWELLERAYLNIGQAALATVPHGFFIDVDPLGLPISRQVGQHRSGPASNVEDPPLLPVARAEVPVQDLQQDPPPADEPPVDVLHLTVFGVILPLQISKPDPLSRQGRGSGSGARK